MSTVKEKNKEMYRLLDQQNLCHKCKKAEQFPNRKFCPECLEKMTITRARHYDKFRKNEESVAARREYQKQYREKHKSEGLCVRCNKKATHGRFCYEHSIYTKRYEERRKERLKRQHRERGLIPEYRKEHNLCYFCGEPIDTTMHGRACSKCAAKFATYGNQKALKKIINNYFTGGKTK